MAAPAPAISRPIPQPAQRHLQVFAFDPSMGKNYGNYMVLDVPFEDNLQPGPIGSRIAVIDYDVANACYYEPVNLDDKWILANDGLGPTESDPRFHQQMVYAVVSKTISRFTFALGRHARWRPDRRRKDAWMRDKLVIMPHAIQEPNAYYDPDQRAIVFGYFNVSEDDPGRNLPSQTVFTCLAHDVIVHETSHALLDGVRAFFMEPTNVDVAAFHEAFADIVALLQHFSLKQAVLDALRGTRGTLFRKTIKVALTPDPQGPETQYQLDRDNPLIGLAAQFGDAIGLRGPLRRMIGTPPNSKALDTMTEPHDRGSILVAAIFDAFFSIFLRRTEDLWRIAGVARENATDANMHPDLLARLADEASKTAGHFETLCIRALDYCPCVDINFGDYLRALITADRDLVTDDDLGYRAALIDAFRSRGIRPEGVTSYSEESLVWWPPEKPVKIDGLRMVYAGMTDDERRRIEESNAKKLHAFARKNAETFGFADRDKLSVPFFHHVQRVSPDGCVLNEMIAQIIERGAISQAANSKKKGKKRQADREEPVQVFGGATVIFDPLGNVRYVLSKSLRKGRPAAQEEFRRQMWEATASGSYEPYRNTRLDFRAIHRGF